MTFMVGDAIMNYLGDLSGAQMPGHAWVVSSLLLSMPRSMGFIESKHKSLTPSTNKYFVCMLLNAFKKDCLKFRLRWYLAYTEDFIIKVFQSLLSKLSSVS